MSSLIKINNKEEEEVNRPEIYGSLILDSFLEQDKANAKFEAETIEPASEEVLQILHKYELTIKESEQVLRNVTSKLAEISYLTKV